MAETTCYICREAIDISHGRYCYNAHNICVECYSHAANVGLSHVVEMLERHPHKREKGETNETA